MSASLRHRAVRVAAELLANTWNMDVGGEEHVADARRTHGRVVFAVWHGQLLAPLWHRRGEGIVLLISANRDAAYLANAAGRWGYSIRSGSSTRGGVAGLRAVVRALTTGHDAAFAPDGPRGPARRVKRGVLSAARLGGTVIVPVGVSATEAWHAGSWDAMLVPRPGARVRIVYGPPVDPRGGGAELQLAAALDAAERQAYQ